MNFLGGTQREEPEVNLTPLIDVVFLLLIFFMVSTTFDRYSQLKIDLPEASAEPTTERADVLDVAIDADGRYFVGRHEVVNRRLATLMDALREAAGGRKHVPVVIRADARTPHQAVVTAMDAAGRLGFNELTIATAESGTAAEAGDTPEADTP